MKIFLLLIILTLSFTNFSLAETPQNNEQRSTQLTLTAFNVKWFGLSGNLWNDPTNVEFRKEYLKRFVDQELPDSEVIVFVEVTNPKLLSEIFAHRFECVTYDRESDRHQRVVTCFDFKKYRVEKYDEDFIIQEVALESTGLRPATQMKLCHKVGNCFLQLIGVHLIAGAKSEARIRQVEFIGADLAKQSNPLPTVVTGDFNSYTTEQSGLPESDIAAFEKILSSPNKVFKSINDTIITYGSGDWARVYDHIVISNDVKSTAIKGYKSCDKTTNLDEVFIPYYSYSRYISDHCPITAKLIIN